MPQKPSLSVDMLRTSATTRGDVHLRTRVAAFIIKGLRMICNLVSSVLELCRLPIQSAMSK